MLEDTYVGSDGHVILQSLVASLHLRSALVAVYSHAHHLALLHRIDIDRWSGVVLLAVDEPLDDGDNQDYRKCGDAIIHVVPCDRQGGGEHEEHCGEDYVGDAELLMLVNG